MIAPGAERRRRPVTGMEGSREANLATPSDGPIGRFPWRIRANDAAWIVLLYLLLVPRAAIPLGPAALQISVLVLGVCAYLVFDEMRRSERSLVSRIKPVSEHSTEAASTSALRR